MYARNNEHVYHVHCMLLLYFLDVEKHAAVINTFVFMSQSATCRIVMVCTSVALKGHYRHAQSPNSQIVQVYFNLSVFDLLEFPERTCQ